MEFWAIAYKYEEDVYYNVKTGDTTDFLTEQCLLPSKDLAEQLIEDEVSADFVPVKIKLETLDKNGIYSWSRGTVGAWDNQG